MTDSSATADHSFHCN